MVEPVEKYQIPDSIQASKQNHQDVYIQTQRYIVLFFNFGIFYHLHQSLTRAQKERQ